MRADLPQRVNDKMKLVCRQSFLICSVLSGGCSDTYNEPVLLDGQKALSEVYKDRPLYSSLYYEGLTQHDEKPVHVFVLKIISKFHPFKTYSFYYLPESQLTIQKNAVDYQDRTNPRLSRRFSYAHNRGEFKITSRDGKNEVIKASFTEEHTYLEDRCLKAERKAVRNSRSYPAVKYAAEICFKSGNFAKSRAFALALNSDIDAFERYTTKGQMLHDYHSLIGQHKLREGATAEAKTHLLLSIAVDPSPVMKSFGPDTSLALALLKAGEHKVVLQYLDGCAKFWKDEPVRIWKRKISSGIIPELNIHRWDRELKVRGGESACARDYRNKIYEQAVESCMLAAKANDAGSQNLLGVMYETGRGVNQDYPQAMYWYELAAKQGGRTAQYNLAQLYRTGKGGVQDHVKAVDYYEMAAEQGHAEAQFSLGIMYFEGSGTPVDMEKARLWWEKAKSNGVTRAEGALNRIP